MKAHKPELHQLGSALDLLLVEVLRERVQLGLPVDTASLTKDRCALEDRLASAFEEIDFDEMPAQWSWEQAALNLAAHIVSEMLQEIRKQQRSDRGFPKYTEEMVERYIGNCYRRSDRRYYLYVVTVDHV